MNVETAVGSLTKLYFSANPGISSFPDATVLLGNGISVTHGLTIYEVSSGCYVADFTPSTTGVYAVFAGGKLIARVEAVAKTAQAYLKNIEDEALGSWSWDKQTGKLTMIRQDGTPLGEFDVIETLEVASRERSA